MTKTVKMMIILITTLIAITRDNCTYTKEIHRLHYLVIRDYNNNITIIKLACNNKLKQGTSNIIIKHLSRKTQEKRKQ